MNGLSLFSGGAIGELAFKQIIPNYRTVGYVEWDNYCQQIIKTRIKDGVLDDAPIFGDIRDFNRRYAGRYIGKVDFISGGFPCQPFSNAGKRKGEDDERNMWPATIECISLLRPKFAFLENVSAIITHPYGRRIQADLAQIGYDCQRLPLSASEVGSPTKRERCWFLGFRDGINVKGLRIHKGAKPEINLWGTQSQGSLSDVETSWLMANNLGCRVCDGVADWVEPIKAIGNGWVPQVVRRILEVRKENE